MRLMDEHSHFFLSVIVRRSALLHCALRPLRRQRAMWLVVAGIAGTAKATVGRGQGVDQRLVNAL
jgi:hypothetical protein